MRYPSIRSLALRVAASILLVPSIAEASYQHFAYANPSLPIVDEQGIYSIEVYPRQHKLIVKKHGQVLKTFSVAVGDPSTPTPVGEYRIIYKGENWGPSFGPRWLGLNVPWGVYGIHGTNKPHSIGQHLSHGCIRMYNKDVTELYGVVPLGTKVSIHGHVLGHPSHDPRNLAEGDVGGDVQLIQSRLKNAGYFQGSCDGKFRSSTTSALKEFQRDHHLPPNGIVTKKVYFALGLLE
ncbi:L,D-transpeptidase family protein [Brevibacillus invocatus]|uniref:L,D-transpeptidase family protein n=1 Tax=Brevibacillus invocatus TaxID=173959 RepID=UPI00203FB381|nr:L,D-transpeptidase family protein [Brevibacillus invocatus]MCM3428918.1 L,D-transpeptidase family protein [Brevibacillus invocatus]